jgi:ketosteroid isomerase-like protein
VKTPTTTGWNPQPRLSAGSLGCLNPRCAPEPATAPLSRQPRLHKPSLRAGTRNRDSQRAASVAENLAARRRLRNTALLLYSIVVFGCGAAPREPLPPTVDMGARCGADLLNEAAIVAVNSAYERALRASDIDALQRLLAPDFLFITSSGEMRDRQEILRSYGAREVNLRVFTSENIRVRFHGSVGILTADITKEGDYATGPRAGAVFTGRYRFTRVYACGAQGWQLASTHESELAG